ncbi:2,3-bisphosphoglycerate-dependent phosphoglycerate mutase [Candidatus Clavichlamydia salmonicola]|uniref:2,3-bisphosphoglycerate-dependent phosphoglycerate mutase n=1 Tax=Candidatus Clavichlamydia salmonicola TaxID=469812 RepID=UPI0018919164|nr:2,3-bisphosphoglycerate-dependent phosphoglycerate mutase [Candidatus Clavichlamydia salmonicola]MBF5050535.1 2,3-bisphosphoglycerate-dependent phosphoglycerate mutase [Candidatus Clavichlamydia salmonicola]
MKKLILLRHGQSVWNKKNLFTGWVDVPLSSEGIQEAFAAGDLLQNEPIDLIFCSTLMRSLMTAVLAISRHKDQKTPIRVNSDGLLGFTNPTEVESSLPVYESAALKERAYGELQGTNKSHAEEIFGKEQVHIWRRSFDIAPPRGESLKDTAARVIPFFKETIVPLLKKDKSIFICAHGNSLRSLMMFIDNLSSEQVLKLELPTGKPFIYDCNQKDFLNS